MAGWEQIGYWLSLAIIAATIIGVAVGRYPFLRMNRATIALTGSTALIVLGALTLEEAYASLDLDTLTLLFAMMVLNVNLRRAGFFSVVGNWVTVNAHSTRQLLALILLTSGILSAVFLNDTIVLVFTPLVLDICATLNRRPIPYLVGLVTAANIGSAATIIGNPQNMIIGVASGLPFTQFTAYLGPVALASLALIWVVIVAVYRQEFAAVPLTKSAGLPADAGQMVTGQMVTVPPLLRKSLIAAALMVVGLVVGMAIPLAALAAASMLLVSRRIEPESVFREVDWSLLVFFAGLFITTGALETLGVSAQLFAVMQLIAEQGLVALTVTGVVLSNLISNVPAVMLFRPFVSSFPAPTQTWLTLAMATTFAGNLTLLGSVANLIVAEIAKRRGVELGFGEYLRAGVPVTLMSLTLGVLWLSFIL